MGHLLSSLAVAFTAGLFFAAIKLPVLILKKVKLDPLQ